MPIRANTMTQCPADQDKTSRKGIERLNQLEGLSSAKPPLASRPASRSSALQDGFSREFVESAGQDLTPISLSSTWRTFKASPAGVKGFCRKARPGSSVP